MKLSDLPSSFLGVFLFFFFSFLFFSSIYFFFFLEMFINWWARSLSIWSCRKYKGSSGVQCAFWIPVLVNVWERSELHGGQEQPRRCLLAISLWKVLLKPIITDPRRCYWAEEGWTMVIWGHICDRFTFILMTRLLHSTRHYFRCWCLSDGILLIDKLP